MILRGKGQARRCDRSPGIFQPVERGRRGCFLKQVTINEDQVPAIIQRADAVQIPDFIEQRACRHSRSVFLPDDHPPAFPLASRENEHECQRVVD